MSEDRQAHKSTHNCERSARNVIENTLVHLIMTKKKWSHTLRQDNAQDDAVTRYSPCYEKIKHLDVRCVVGYQQYDSRRQGVKLPRYSTYI